MADELKVKRATAKGQFTISEKRLKDALNNIVTHARKTLQKSGIKMESCPTNSFHLFKLCQS